MKTLVVTVALVVVAGAANAEEQMCRNKKGDINTRPACRPDETVANVLEADDRMVEGCAYLGDVTASSGWGGLAQGLGQSRARSSAFRRAAKKGATHLVWSRQSSGYAGANASGRAYKCEQDTPSE